MAHGHRAGSWTRTTENTLPISCPQTNKHHLEISRFLLLGEGKGTESLFEAQKYRQVHMVPRVSLVAHGKEPTCQCRRHGFNPWVRKTPEGNGNLPQYSCLGNLMDRGVGWVTVHRVSKSQT